METRMRINSNIILPLMAFVYTTVLADTVLQVTEDPFSIWVELGKYGSGGLLAGLIWWQSRKNDEKYQATLLEINKSANEREDKVLAMVTEVTRVMERVVQILDTKTNLDLIRAELQELKQSHGNSPRKQRQQPGA